MNQMFDLANAICAAVGIDPSTIRELTLRLGVGEVPTIEAVHVALIKGEDGLVEVANELRRWRLEPIESGAQ